MTFRIAFDSASIEVHPASGGRLSSLIVDGHELLVSRTTDDLGWGCYPMVPFAGRVRHGVLDFDGTRTQLPHGLGMHAIHGFGYTSRWVRTKENEISFDFSDQWPYGGTATQSFVVDANRIRMTMRVNAHDRQPVGLGWHPWFRRDNRNGHSARPTVPRGHDVRTGF